MNMFVLATETDRPDNNLVFSARLLVAALLSIVALAQLFKFENFPIVLASYSLPGAESMATLMAGLIVTMEVFAVPYLLMMKLSPLMRIVSCLSGWASAILWIILGVLFLAKKNSGVNAGLMGDTIPITNGWSLVLFGIVLLLGLLIARPKSITGLFPVR